MPESTVTKNTDYCNGKTGLDLLDSGQALVIKPELVELVGKNEAIFLQQLHYWLGKDSVGHVRDGFKWVYNTGEQWKENFPFWSVRTIRRIIASLKKQDVLLMSRFNKSQYDQTNFFTIDYDMLNEKASPDKIDEHDNVDVDVADVSKNEPKTPQKLVCANVAQSLTQRIQNTLPSKIINLTRTCDMREAPPEDQLKAAERTGEIKRWSVDHWIAILADRAHRGLRLVNDQIYQYCPDQAMARHLGGEK